MKIVFTILAFVFCFSASAQQSYKAICIDSCYDGDTPELFINIYQNTWIKQKVRLYGVDTPEMKGADSLKAIQARLRLINLILNKSNLWFSFSKRKDKYGRALGTIFIINKKDTLNVNNIMLQYGKEYYGGKKQ